MIFLDSGRTATRKPNQKFPDGMDVDLRADPEQKHCCTNVPYPAPRVGAYNIFCNKCKLRVAVTVAGRPDDPRTVTMPCKVGGLDA